MNQDTKIELSKGFAKRLASRIEQYDFEVGILTDGPHYDPVETNLFDSPELGQYAGGPVRKKTRVEGEKTIAEVFVANMERMNTDLLLEPFRSSKNAEITKFTTAFLRLATGGKITLKRVENLLQAVVRNPILRQDYGGNTAPTADAKGFDRLLIDTAQMFKAIKARAKRV
ncbi:putative neck protein [Bdellovibrio phage MAC3UK]|nr:putative neck protein [Bdellovibrio phage MAC3UK]